MEYLHASDELLENPSSLATDDTALRKEIQNPLPLPDAKAHPPAGVNHDILRLYLNEMGRVPLLAREDELRVGTEIRIAWKRYSVLIFESALGIRETLRLLED